MKPYVKHAEVITNGKIKGILTNLKHVGGAICFEKSGRIARVSLKARDLHMHALGDFAREVSNIPFVQYLTRKHKRLYKLLFAERLKEIILQARIGDRQRIAAALKSSLTQKFVHLSDFIPFPLAINDLDDPERLVCDPEGVKSTTRDYFTRLYDHSRVPDLPKPWLSTPSVKEIKDRLADDPFIWPVQASLSDF